MFGWRYEGISLSRGSYMAMDLGRGIGGGIVECEARRPGWLPYMQVDDIDAVTERARALGACVLLEPRAGAAGWRSVVVAPEGAEVGLWQPRE